MIRALSKGVYIGAMRLYFVVHMLYALGAAQGLDGDRI